MKEKVAKWLANQVDTTDIQSIQLEINDQQWDGASFIRSGEQMYYLVGKRPIYWERVCYILQVDDSGVLGKIKEHEWFIGGWVEKDPTPDDPFGDHWIMVPWIIEDEPNSRIDEFESEQYQRIFVTLKEF